MARVYLSSTFQDLKEHREAVRLQLQRLHLADVAMEIFVPGPNRPVDKCIRDVRSCDLYIGLFAWRYGHIPKGYDRSITEIEYRTAVENGKDRLIFLLDQDAPWPRSAIDTGPPGDRIEALRAELAEENLCIFFSSADSLAAVIVPAVVNWLRDRGPDPGIGGAVPEDRDEAARDIIARGELAAASHEGAGQPHEMGAAAGPGTSAGAADSHAGRVRETAVVQAPQLHQPKIFLCYRREDTQGFARGIYENLAAKYGHEQVFRDIDSTPAGVRYSTWIESRVGQCSVMIVLIGHVWSSVKDRAGQRRLDSPKDWVRQEIEAALNRDIPIIPIRMQGALMPSEEELPSSIADLTGFQHAEVTDSRWTYDMGLLIEAIDNLMRPDQIK
jgi:Domain of unknown function (DUF4062)/TIR domain